MKAWSTKGELGKRIRTFPVAAKVNNLVFVHAGIKPEFVRNGKLDSVIANMMVATAGLDVKGDPQTSSGNGMCWLSTKKAVDEHFEHNNLPNLRELNKVIGKHGPVWTRYLAKGKDPCAEASKTLKKLKAERIVVGHTIQKNKKVNARCRGSVILADTAISKCYRGEMSYIVHNEDGTGEVNYPRTNQKVKLPRISPWPKKTKPHAFLQVRESQM